MSILLIFLLKILTMLIVLQCHGINGSRNLAYMKSASASSVLTSKPEWNATKAVDGNSSNNVWCNTCLHTDNTPGVPAYLTVDLGQISTINRVEIYFVKYDEPDHFCKHQTGNSALVPKRSRGYSLILTTGSKNVTCFHDNSTSGPTFNFTQNQSCIGNAEKVTVFQPNPRSGTPGPILEICELEVFGCPIGTYGKNCSGKCSHFCKNNTCDPDNGVCKNGCLRYWSGDHCNNHSCPVGTYGENCTRMCSHFCLNNICDPDNGTCTNGCVEDWSGDHCNETKNLAYMKSATSSSVLSSKQEWNAAKAVDGNSSNNVWCNTCLHTDNTPGVPAYLTVDLGQMSTISRVEIYFVKYDKPDNSCNQQTGKSITVPNRSRGYSVILSTDSSNITCFQDKTTTEMAFSFTQIHSCSGNAEHVTVFQPNPKNGETGPILEICELKVFGCLKGKYGEHCNYSCPVNCLISTCDPDNGTCSHGCTEGHKGLFCKEPCINGSYGFNCNESCGHCKHNKTCDRINGSCPQGLCDRGYDGSLCIKACANKTYGYDCNDTCGHCRNNDTCDIKDGHCTDGMCEEGFNGTLCKEECHNRTYGFNCKYTCGHCREGAVCDKVNGKCPLSLCERGFNGSLCNKACVNATFGYNCNETCGHCRNDTTCDKLYGNCTGGLCEKGFNGSLCLQDCTNGTYGYNCEQTCGACRNGAACDKKNGECPSALCDRGFNGSLCNETCSDGTFGYNCNETCGYCRNNSACDKNYGNCTDGLCEKGFNGSNCVTECADGYYGYNCFFNCGKCANQMVCNKTTGICPNGVCGRGVNGSKCDQVCNGTYGYNCNETCGHCQKDLHCDARYGNCSQSMCIWGFTGLYCDVEASQQTDSDNTPVIAGGTAAVLLVAILVIVIVIILKRRKMSDQKPSENNEQEFSDFGTAQTRKSRGNEQNKSGVYASTKKMNSYMDIKDTQAKDANDEEIEQEYVNVQLGKRPDKDYQMPCRTLADIVKEKENDENKIFKEEFGALPKGQLKPCEAAKMPSNMPKNRFKTTFPYDDTRIVLKTDGAKESDYVNANYIKDTNGRCTYIASQGPRTHTVVDMWRMVWQEEISCIVMLTNLQEKRIDKCAKYWPNVTCTEIYGQISIKTIKENIYGNYTIRVFKITNTQESESRDVSHYHYTTWPDHGVPESLDLVIFHNKVQRQAMSSSKSGALLLVHCSAGIGRTGTFIALDALLSHSKDNDSVNIFQFVKHMREEDRMNMIQTVDQYVAIHHLLLEAIRTRYYPIPKSSFGEDVKRMSSTSSPANQNVFRRQISELNDLKPNYSDDDFTRGLHNQDRNIDPNILPVDRYMLYLTTFVKGRNDYINAITVPIQTALHSIVVTSNPKDNTTVDLIRLILDHGSFVVDLSGSTNDQQWYPDPSTTRSYNPFEVERSELKTSNIANVTESDCTIFQKQKDSAPLSFRLFESKIWPSDVSDEDGLRALCGLVRRVMLWNRTSTNGKLILVSKDGVTRCDVFCAVYNAFEQLELDEEVDMFNIVRQLQIRRPQFIPTMEEYKLCFDAVSYDLESNNESIYANV